MQKQFWIIPTLIVAASLANLACPPDGPDDEEGVQDAADRFFVDSVRGNDTNAGRRASPLQTIQEGIDRAATAGGDGGDGGDGAQGGPGGGGGGGPVIGIAHDQGSAPSMSNTQIVLGTPGAGGMSPAATEASTGATGLATDIFEYSEAK